MPTPHLNQTFPGSSRSRGHAGSQGRRLPSAVCPFIVQRLFVAGMRVSSLPAGEAGLVSPQLVSAALPVPGTRGEGPGPRPKAQREEGPVSGSEDGLDLSSRGVGRPPPEMNRHSRPLDATAAVPLGVLKRGSSSSDRTFVSIRTANRNAFSPGARIYLWPLLASRCPPVYL